VSWVWLQAVYPGGMDAAIRDPAVAGTFYPARAAEVERALGRLFVGVAAGDRPAVGVVCPHAGWIYSERWRRARWRR
jgi:AmmeMemoRadiSam system protein B